MGQLQESAVALFTNGHISQFVYVDDRFGNGLVDKEQCKDFVRDHLGEVDIISHKEIWEDEFEEWWRNTPEGERQRFFNNLGLKAEDADFLRRRFESFLPVGVIQRYLSPEQFDESREQILGMLDKEHQLLILFDYRLEDYGRTGEQVLQQIADRDFVNCAIFSGTFPIEDELDKWSTSAQKNNIFVLSKRRIESDDDLVILEGLRNVLWLKQIFKLKKYAQNLVEKASTSMCDRLDIMDPSTFHKVVMDRSADEGCWELETLMRIVQAYMNLGMKDYLSSEGFAVFQSLTSELRAIRNDAQAKEPDAKVIIEISKEEVFEDQGFINKTYSQVSNGDIFSIGQAGKKYILLCQPCNLEIRNSGKRTKQNFDEFFLVPIREYADGDKEKQGVCLLRSVKGEKEFVAEFSKYIRVSLSLLDLVTFNSEGKAVIDLAYTPDSHPNKTVVQSNMLKRYGEIHSKVLAYKNKYEKLHSSDLSEEDKRMMSKDYCRPYEIGDSKVIKKPTLQHGSIIDFGITRVGRYKDPYATVLLQLFMDYFSRPAYPMKL